MRPTWRRRAVRYLWCCLAAAAVQIPVAWLWAIAYVPGGYSEDTTCVYPPAGSSSPCKRLDVTNCGYMGVRWVSVTAWAAPPGWSPVRSHPGEPYDHQPAYPWRSADVSTAIDDPTRWPMTPINLRFVEVRASGWPWLCVRGRSGTHPTTGVNGVSGMILIDSPRGQNWPRHDVALCYWPMWPGFAFNTLAYALVFFAAASLAIDARTTIRLRRRQCPACGYDRRGVEYGQPCPECGRPLGTA